RKFFGDKTTTFLVPVVVAGANAMHQCFRDGHVVSGLRARDPTTHGYSGFVWVRARAWDQQLATTIKWGVQAMPQAQSGASHRSAPQKLGIALALWQGRV